MTSLTSLNDTLNIHNDIDTKINTYVNKSDELFWKSWFSGGLFREIVAPSEGEGLFILENGCPLGGGRGFLFLKIVAPSEGGGAFYSWKLLLPTPRTSLFWGWGILQLRLTGLNCTMLTSLDDTVNIHMGKYYKMSKKWWFSHTILALFPWFLVKGV